MARAARVSDFKDDHQKAICKAFYSLSDRHSRHALWSDFITLSACTIGQIDPLRKDERERMYEQVAKSYTPEELDVIAQMFAQIVLGLEENPDQDFLGDLFMKLELSNEYRGQFFTPYCVCKMMAEITEPSMGAEIEQRGFISVNDPACGAGALLVAFANEALSQKVNYQQSVLFVAQDIDFTAAMMCYIQLSLLGCPGYVIVGNTLTTPPTTPLTEQNVWYTPFYFMGAWPLRELLGKVEHIATPNVAETEASAPAKEEFEQMSLL